MEWTDPYWMEGTQFYKDTVWHLEGMEIGAVSLESWRAVMATVQAQSAFQHEQDFADWMAKHLAAWLFSPVDTE